MNNVKITSRHGYSTFFKGLLAYVGGLAIGAALLVPPMTASAAPADAMTQLDALQMLVQLCGDSDKVGDLTAVNLVKWATERGLVPTGGWKTDVVLTKQVLAQLLVQLANINPNKMGGDFVRILKREGVNLPDEDQITRKIFVQVIDEPFVVNQFAKMDSSPSQSNNGHYGTMPPPGWTKNPNNPHFGDVGNPGKGHAPTNPGKKG